MVTSSRGGTGATRLWRSMSWRRFRWVLGLGLVSAWMFTAVSPAAQAPSEALVKAALVYKLIRFVEWPGSALGASGVVDICVADNAAVVRALAESGRAQTTADRTVAVRAARDGVVDGCDVVFIGAESIHIDPILRSALGRPVLTIGETSGFADRGGMVNLVRDGRHLRLEVNRDSLSRSGLVLSSLVLSLARTVFR